MTSHRKNVVYLAFMSMMKISIPLQKFTADCILCSIVDRTVPEYVSTITENFPVARTKD